MHVFYLLSVKIDLLYIFVYFFLIWLELNSLNQTMSIKLNSVFDAENRNKKETRAHSLRDDSAFHWKTPSTLRGLKDHISTPQSPWKTVRTENCAQGWNPSAFENKYWVPLHPVLSTCHKLNVWNNRFQCRRWNEEWLLALGHGQGGFTPVVYTKPVHTKYVLHTVSCALRDSSLLTVQILKWASLASLLVVKCHMWQAHRVHACQRPSK